MNLSHIPTEFGRGYIASRSHAHDGIFLSLDFVDICNDNLHDAMLFAQIIYWHGFNAETGEPRLKHRCKKDGQLWLVKKHGEWYDECRIKERTAPKCLGRLKELNLIHYKVGTWQTRPAPFIRVNWEGFEAALNALHKAKRKTKNQPETPDDTSEQPDKVNNLLESERKLPLLLAYPSYASSVAKLRQQRKMKQKLLQKLLQKLKPKDLSPTGELSPAMYLTFLTVIQANIADWIKSADQPEPQAEPPATTEIVKEKSNTDTKTTVNIWQEVVARAFGVKPGGFAGRYVNFFKGACDYTDPKSVYMQHQLADAPATPQEIVGLTLWYRQHPRYGEPRNRSKQQAITLPRTVETLRERVDEFRSDHAYEDWLCRGQDRVDQILGKAPTQKQEYWFDNSKRHESGPGGPVQLAPLTDEVRERFRKRYEGLFSS